MIEFTLPKGQRMALNVNAINIVSPFNENDLDTRTVISLYGAKSYVVQEGYHEVLDKIAKANKVFIGPSGKILEV